VYISTITKTESKEGLAMLVLSRKESEKIRLGDDIIITVVRVAGDKVRLGIEAPNHVPVLRRELKRHDSETTPEQPAKPSEAA